MTRPNDSSGSDSAKWWNEKSRQEFEKLEFLQKQMKRAMNEPMAEDDEEEDMGPPDLPEDDDAMPPDLPEDDDIALEPTSREIDMQDRMMARRSGASRRPRARSRATSMMDSKRPMGSKMPTRQPMGSEMPMKSGKPKGMQSKALKAELELKRAFSPEKRRILAKQGKALPDGSFPIVTSTDLKNAIMAFGRATNKSAAKRHIIKRARALKKENLIPETWGKKDAKGYGMPMGPMSDPMMPKPKKKKTFRYGEKEADMAEMEDDEMSQPMSREQLMEQLFKKKKKKSGMDKMPDEDMPAEDEEME